ncbi:hypothetical protein A2866_04640 [Candidatus Roizmanbacteria bacterium RIFCSPHIGHO2_01_FULL_39_8]|uniref:EamA domain-containing protein n=2 Tax=Candidatus Roizmaniibacteriota TaxID=1752723 RepID=A0A1F7GMZ1_9BACT|nr:MAG: hypothetical protein A2866_04640 [Candidatus Roizmanbacteria bacterium RIFCSPHIGHO2_01_FULL_39_8]OGK26055.1 MAG: hypothetical protein A3C28_03420 [Candidatus Roizmanbacteria bacterium RIFCSPHIGHO2_02_FULL_39_9]
MRQAFVATTLFCFFYGLQLVYQQIFVRGTIEPLHLNFLSYLLISIVLTIYYLFFNRRTFLLKPNTKALPFFLIALFGWVIADFSAVYGLKFSSSANYSMLSRLMIFVVFTLSVVFLKEKITKKKLFAIAISFVGGFLVIYHFGSQIKINAGDIFFLITVLTLSASSVARQKVTKHISSFQLTYLLFVYATVILGTATFIFMPIQSILSYQFIIFNSIVALVGFSLVNYAIQKGGAVFFTLVSTLLPVFTILFSFLILKQLPIATQLIGGTLIIVSIFIFLKK